jgi:REP-associated tyrosine transposase
LRGERRTLERMPRIARKYLPSEGIYHVTARSVHGQPLFVHDVDRLEFLSIFEKATREAGWRCHAWCLLDTHYHLVLETSMSMLSHAMHWLNTSYAQRFNRRHGRRGHLFDSRFSAWVIRDDAHLEATCRYVLDNPARAGLDTAHPWPWAALHPYSSSARTPSSETSAKSSYDRPTA